MAWRELRWVSGLDQNFCIITASEVLSVDYACFTQTPVKQYLSSHHHKTRKPGKTGSNEQVFRKRCV